MRRAPVDADGCGGAPDAGGRVRWRWMVWGEARPGQVRVRSGTPSSFAASVQTTLADQADGGRGHETVKGSPGGGSGPQLGARQLEPRDVDRGDAPPRSEVGNRDALTSPDPERGQLSHLLD